MRPSISIIVSIALLGAILWIAMPRAGIVSAAPHAQATVAPTEEPTKPPYVFPTPIIIPNYPDDTPTPRATPGATRAPGQPGEQTYTIQSGDSPWSIAQKMYGDGSKYPLIMSANNLTSTTRLRVGAVLVIPPLSGSAPPPTPTAALIAPTPVPPTVGPAPSPTSAAPTPQPTPTPTRGALGATPEMISIGINILGGILFVGSLLCAILAYVAYDRARRMERLATGKRPIRVRQ